MSKLNISGIIKNIKSKTNIYTPIIEAIINSIDAINDKQNGQIEIVVCRENSLFTDNVLHSIKSIKIIDNGVGFSEENRNSFDTFLSDTKINTGGKGFGRFMYLKYFNEVKIESQYIDKDGNYKIRNFRFGKDNEIIIDEKEYFAKDKTTGTKLFLENIIKKEQLDVELEIIALKLVEKLIVFFIDPNSNTPIITLREQDNSKQIILNNYINDKKNILKIDEQETTLINPFDNSEQKFFINTYKIYFSSQGNKICLTAHNREITESTIHSYIPEFSDVFLDDKNSKKYIIKSYVRGEYLNNNVSLERESFNLTKEDNTFPYLTQQDIEEEVANVVKKLFEKEIKNRFDEKVKKITNYVNIEAPWYKNYLKDFDFTDLPTNISNDKIDFMFQKIKLKKEQEIRAEIKKIVANKNDITEEKFQQIISNISENSKNDLAHYVCNRKLIIDTFDELRKRRKIDNKPHLEKKLHNLIFPMHETSDTLEYENHNLWLLDERLVFSEYIASDKIISKNDIERPDLVIFHNKIIYRNGDNNTNNPVSIFEFKRPKRKNYDDNENPIKQICLYVEKIRNGKYEMPEGIEPIKASNETPFYVYIVADRVDKIEEFAKDFSLTSSPDKEGYFGFHPKYEIYIEIMSYRKIINDAKMRNKIFFKKLGIE